LDDQFNFKLSVIVDAQNVRGNLLFCIQLNRSFLFRLPIVLINWICNFVLNFILRKRIIRMLWLKSIERFSFVCIFRTEKLSTMQQLCSRCYKLYFNPRLGIHTHIPILFDYFHLSALTTTIHASLLCLIPPYAFDR
jgi:hypothetical protein